MLRFGLAIQRRMSGGEPLLHLADRRRVWLLLESAAAYPPGGCIPLVQALQGMGNHFLGKRAGKYLDRLPSHDMPHLVSSPRRLTCLLRCRASASEPKWLRSARAPAALALELSSWSQVDLERLYCILQPPFSQRHEAPSSRGPVQWMWAVEADLFSPTPRCQAPTSLKKRVAARTLFAASCE